MTASIRDGDQSIALEIATLSHLHDSIQLAVTRYLSHPLATWSTSHSNTNPQSHPPSSSATQSHGTGSTASDYSVAGDTTVLPAYGQKDTQRIVCQRELLPEAAYQDGYRQRHLALGKLAVASVDARRPSQVSTVRRDSESIYQRPWLTLSRAQQTRKTSAHNPTTPHIRQLYPLDPARPSRAPNTIAPQPPVYRCI